MADRDEVRAKAEARLGCVVGSKFRLNRVLGVGGMATVYEATHRNGKRVALKLLHGELTTSERQRKRFIREAHVANAIDHPGIVQIHDDGIDPELGTFLIVELLEGESVSQLQRRHGGGLDPGTVVRIADQVLDVLIAAHARGVVHRDIKPDNLFVVEGGALKVLDFGIARFFEPVPGATLDTQAGTLLGTPAFMPQEQARGRWDEVDARSDLWSVGATMFSLLSGEHVHRADTPNEQLGRAMTMPARSLATVVPALPPDLIAIVDRALRYSPTERWPDARSMQAALRGVNVAGTALPRTTKEPLPASLERTLPAVLDLPSLSSPPRRSWRKALAMGVVLAGILGWLWMSAGSRASSERRSIAATAPTPEPIEPEPARTPRSDDAPAAAGAEGATGTPIAERPIEQTPPAFRPAARAAKRRPPETIAVQSAEGSPLIRDPLDRRR